MRYINSLPFIHTSIFEVVLRINYNYVVDINVFHTLPLFKFKIQFAKACSCAYGAKYRKTPNCLQKGQMKANPTEIKPERG